MGRGHFYMSGQAQSAIIHYETEFENEDGEMEEAGQLFNADDIWWADPHNESDDACPNTGLYFLADGSDEAIEKYLRPVLRLLRHTGIGHFGFGFRH